MYKAASASASCEAVLQASCRPEQYCKLVAGLSHVEDRQSWCMHLACNNFSLYGDLM